MAWPSSHWRTQWNRRAVPSGPLWKWSCSSSKIFLPGWKTRFQSDSAKTHASVCSGTQSCGMDWSGTRHVSLDSAISLTYIWYPVLLQTCSQPLLLVWQQNFQVCFGFIPAVPWRKKGGNQNILASTWISGLSGTRSSWCFSPLKYL